jgi:urease accessory protein UreF
MLHQTQKALTTAAAELLGDLRPLLEQVGAPSGSGDVSGLIPARPVQDLPELRAFLQTYHARILQPLELPAIQRAFGHAAHNEVRELIALDRQLSAEPALKNFASPSRLVGRAQLERLRPLRDERLVQRYLAAVEHDEAHGWHTLVYGVTLAVYSLPLRQGLLGYARQTTRGFIQASAPSLSLTAADCDTLHEELCAGLSTGIESLLSPGITA